MKKFKRINKNPYTNTEKMVVYFRDGIYFNQVLKFQGTKEEAIDFAENHNFGGGIEIVFERKNKQFTK